MESPGASERARLVGVKICGFKLGTRVSISEDEVFLRIQLSGPQKAGYPRPIEAIATHEEVRMAVRIPSTRRA